LLLVRVHRQVLGGGGVEVQGVPVPANFPGVSSLDVAVATDKRIRKFALVPGLKWNLKGSFVFSGNAIVSLSDTGLHDLFTPVVGLDWTF
jgi:hypothetical protein